MAFSLNRAQIIGNLTRDPEMRTTGSGTAVTSFSVATNFTFTDSNGQKQDRSQFHNIVAWRRLGEIIHQYARKGTKIFVEGRLETSEWEGKDGIKRYRTEIVADNFILLDSRGAPRSDQPQFEREHQPVGDSDYKHADEEPDNIPREDAEEVSIDDLPF